MGKYFTAALAAIVLLGVAASAQAEPCQLVKFTQFDISEAMPYRPIIPVSVNGVTLPFLVDTGGYFSLLSEAAADKLNLEKRDIRNGVELYRVDGTRLAKYVVAQELKIGPVPVPGAKLVLRPDYDDGLGGILAPELLENFDLDFDFGNNALNLFSPKHCPGKVVYWAKQYGIVPFDLLDQHIVVTVVLDGREYRAALDTGAIHSTFLGKIARRDFGLAPGTPDVEPMPKDYTGTLMLGRHRFHSLTIGDVTVKNPEMTLMEDQMERGYRDRHSAYKSDTDPVYGTSLQQDPMILGMDILSKLHVYIAYGEKTLFVTPAKP